MKEKSVIKIDTRNTIRDSILYSIAITILLHLVFVRMSPASTVTEVDNGFQVLRKLFIAVSAITALIVLYINENKQKEEFQEKIASKKIKESEVRLETSTFFEGLISLGVIFIACIMVGYLPILFYYFIRGLLIS